jgi:xylulose-5-phosphate/fructose-6-phosphate phosphoketolase
MKTNTLTPDLLHKMNAYWRAANYLSVGQIYLYDNPLLKRPLTLADVKHMLLGQWGQPRLSASHIVVFSGIQKLIGGLG